MSPRAPELAIRATAAVLVLVDGHQAELGPLIAGASEPRTVLSLERQLCCLPREDRARAIASVLTVMAFDLDDWRLR